MRDPGTRTYITSKRVDVIRHRLFCGECVPTDDDPGPSEMRCIGGFTTLHTTWQYRCPNGHEASSRQQYPYNSYQEV